MRGRWGSRRVKFDFKKFIQAYFEKINLSDVKTLRNAKDDFEVANTGGSKRIEDLDYTDMGGIWGMEATTQFSKKQGGGGTPTAAIFTTIDTHTWTVPASATYRVYACGGAGAGASGLGGYGGLFYADISLIAGETVEVGVGAGGLGNASYGNASNYPMRGGSGGPSSITGAGGGGSYLKLPNSGSRPRDANGYAIIAGGGGGSADHSFTANFGGHGFGNGGPAYSVDYANIGSGGKNGFDGNGGTGGPIRSGSTPSQGGSANASYQYIGGNGGDSGSQNSGGGGGGGAGGGGGGGAGSAVGGDGGYLSTNTVVNGYTTSTIARGGGGGGGHNNNCGACGAGGGVLLFSSYNNSWGTTQGSQVPHWSSSSLTTTTMSDYTAYSQFNTDTSTYLSQTGFGGIVPSTSGVRGNVSADGQNGFVAIIPLQATTYTTY